MLGLSRTYMVCDHCCRLCAAAFDFAKRIYVDPVCCGCGAMTVLAYHIVPDETDDLYRYYGMLIFCESRERPVWTISSI